MNEYAMSPCNEGIRYIAMQSYSIYITDENTKIEPISHYLEGEMGGNAVILVFFACVCAVVRRR